jgi:hypothetical protein
VISPRLRPSALALLAAILLAGCAGTSELLHRPPPPKTHAGAIYLQRLGTLQGSLAAIERTVPRRPHTPAQLARSVSTLARAMGGLAAGLRGVKPPSPVRAPHIRLIAIARAYQRQLIALVPQLRDPVSEVSAADALARATEAASSAFAATSAEIRRRLAK